MRKTCPACNSTKYKEVKTGIFACGRCKFVYSKTKLTPTELKQLGF